MPEAECGLSGDSGSVSERQRSQHEEKHLLESLRRPQAKLQIKPPPCGQGLTKG
jgi:hypothetical protein